MQRIVNNRDELIHLLGEAAELEHLLCCQYLFAGYSLKPNSSPEFSYKQQSIVHDWAQMFFMIARQEMEHLGLVCNILTAIGAAPHFGRPNFPQNKAYFPVPMTLEPFSEKTLERFLEIEKPQETPPPKPTVSGEEEYEPVQITSIEDIYDRIAWLIRHIPMPENELFIGPPKAQIDGNITHTNFPRPGALGGVFDVTLFAITNRATALKAIDLIIEQGEGTPGHNEFTHYKWYNQMLAQYRQLKEEDPLFEPTRKMVSNPQLYQKYDAGEEHVITNPTARAVLDLFNGAYETLLLLFIRFYAHTDETKDDFAALWYTLFPLMTMIVRPLSEILVTLPAYEEDAQAAPDDPDVWRAGPSFEVSSDALHLLPHKSSAWRVLDERLQNLAQYSKELSKREGIPARMGYIAENLGIMSSKFSMVADGTYPPELLIPGIILPPS